MALPYIFASVSTMTTPQLDANFAALGALTPIPCSVSGTNAIALTPAANTPTVAAYQNYMQFTFIAAGTTTGLVTAQVGSLASLKVFVDSSSGVAQATTGQIVANTASILMYDSTLDGGTGGFHLISTVVLGSFLPLAGGTLTGPLIGTSIGLTGPLTAASATVTGQLKGATVTATGAVSGATISASTRFTGAAATLSGNLTASVASVSALNIGGGPNITRQLWTTVTLSYGAIGPGSAGDQTVTLTGVKVGDPITFGVPSAPTVGIGFNPFCATNDTVVMRAFNFSTVTLTPPAGVYEVAAQGFT